MPQLGAMLSTQFVLEAIEVETPLELNGPTVGAGRPSNEVLGNTFGYGFSINDVKYACFEIPRNWGEVSGFEILLHIAINEAYSAHSSKTRWSVSWGAAPENGSEAIDAPVHSGVLNSGIVNIPGIAKAPQEISVGTIPASSLVFGDLVTMQIKRIALGAGTNPTPNPVMVLVEFRYTKG